MRAWWVGTVLVLPVVSGLIGWAATSALNDTHHLLLSSDQAGDGEIVNIPLNPEYGMHYRVEIRAVDGRTFDVLFSDLDGLTDARWNGTMNYVEERSFLNVTDVSIEGQLPDDADIYQLMIVSSDANVTVQLSASGLQGNYPLVFQPVIQAVSFITWISATLLFVIFIYSVFEYRQQRRRER